MLLLKRHWHQELTYNIFMPIMCQKLNFNVFKSHAHLLNVYLFSKELAEDTLWSLKKL